MRKTHPAAPGRGPAAAVPTELPPRGVLRWGRRRGRQGEGPGGSEPLAASGVCVCMGGFCVVFSGFSVVCIFIDQIVSKLSSGRHQNKRTFPH